ncbi:MAG: hypothetical protein EOM24_24415 [Chloroflexia bacterium]|nr:hypothetical protein [Chloroflexia bacterium]
MQIYVGFSGFGGLLGDEDHYHPLPATLEDLALAIVTAGRSGWPDVFKGDIYRLYEITAILLKTQAYVAENGEGLVTTGLYRNLDATEKAAASYRIGMGLAKLVAERHLGVPWLRHVDPLIRQNVIQTELSTHVRPDMVGQGVDRKWHVVEAKGRSSADSSAVSKGQQQAAAIARVAGSTPQTRSACVSMLRYEPFYVDLVNTPANGSLTLGAFDMVAPRLFGEEYYSLIRGLIQTTDSDDYRVPRIDSWGNTGSFRVFSIRGTNIALGIHMPIYDYFLAGDRTFLDDYFADSDFRGWVNYWNDYRREIRLRQPEVFYEQHLSISQDGYLLLKTG